MANLDWPPFKYFYVTAGTQLIKTGPGMVHTITVVANGTSTPVMVAFDSTTGSTGTILAYNSAGQASTGATVFTLDAAFQNGLFIAMGGGCTSTVTYF
jgi:hypothetical protein